MAHVKNAIVIKVLDGIISQVLAASEDTLISGCLQDRITSCNGLCRILKVHVFITSIRTYAVRVISKCFSSDTLVLSGTKLEEIFSNPSIFSMIEGIQ